jgi:hypothetical protein
MYLFDLNNPSEMYDHDLNRKSANCMINRQRGAMSSLEIDFRCNRLEFSCFLECRS